MRHAGVSSRHASRRDSSSRGGHVRGCPNGHRKRIDRFLLHAATCLLPVLTTLTTQAATIGGRITNCGGGAPGCLVEAFEELIVGIELDDPFRPGASRCVNAQPRSKSPGTDRTDAGGNYAISFTSIERSVQIQEKDPGVRYAAQSRVDSMRAVALPPDRIAWLHYAQTNLQTRRAPGIRPLVADLRSAAEPARGAGPPDDTGAPSSVPA